MNANELENNVRAWVIHAQGVAEIGGDTAGARNEAVENIVRLVQGYRITPLRHRPWCAATSTRFRGLPCTCGGGSG